MKYSEKDLVQIAKRENNTKRSYLVVDPLQGKHVPVSPKRALSLFDCLAEELSGKYKEERLLLIGFAETATAIGAHVAISMGTKYMQTTREVIPGVEYLFFSETHSHATEQKLVKDDIDAVIHDIDRIIFVEDEVTTGNTILQIIRILQKAYKKNIKFAVASLLNGMTKKHLEVFAAEKIDLYYLVKTDHSQYGELADSFLEDGKYDDVNNTATNFIISNVEGWMNARRILDSSEYEDACRVLAKKVIDRMEVNSNDRILVIGSEEFMYPALYIGKEMEELGYHVRCHSTTRSPIVVSSEKDYPLHHRYTLQSLYDSNRTTYIYDIEEYDQVLVVTDSELKEQQGIQSLVGALGKGCKKINIIRWC
ncbi:MAG: hypothetical protein PWP24_1420 [Clostridiales bacterium]|nr:hypothetical protein [Clostridiales bacterium]